MNDSTLDNPELWQRAVSQAVVMGCMHARIGRKAITEAELIDKIQSSLHIVHYRNGHTHSLRAAYGAAYKGIAMSQRCLKQAANS